MKNKYVTLELDSFDGGGPKFKVVISKPEIVSYTREVKYFQANHEELDGAGYKLILLFYGEKPGETLVAIEERCPLACNLDHIYRVIVDNELNITITKVSDNEIEL